jgi:hypothetical protein
MGELVQRQLDRVENRVGKLEALESFSTGSGTSFPLTPSVNQRFFRTDRGIEYYWNGTLWLSELKTILMSTNNIITSDNIVANANALHQCKHPSYSYDIMLVSAEVLSFVTTTHNSTNYWIIDFCKQSTTAVATVIGTVNSWQTGRTTSTEYPDTIALNLRFASATNPQFVINYTKSNTPGPMFFCTASINYQLVG